MLAILISCCNQNKTKENNGFLFFSAYTLSQPSYLPTLLSFLKKKCHATFLSFVLLMPSNNITINLEEPVHLCPDYMFMQFFFYSLPYNPHHTVTLFLNLLLQNNFLSVYDFCSRKLSSTSTSHPSEMRL